MQLTNMDNESTIAHSETSLNKRPVTRISGLTMSALKMSHSYIVELDNGTDAM